ncbi:MAG: hypothetical protein PWQ10_323 [Patescibacteria group bacterium]|nr:hypothetical protein [Patescibacteria group bacterium]
MNLHKKLTNQSVKNQMSDNRFKHTLKVVENAKKLAAIHKEDIKSAETAALMHDFARDWDFADVIKYLEDRKITIPDDKRNNPILLHGLVASIIAKEEFNINNQDIINSIKNHILGSKNMSNLEKIIFLSDFLSWKDRGADHQIFEVAQDSLNKAVVTVYEKTYESLNNDKSPIAKEFYDNWEANKTNNG